MQILAKHASDRERSFLGLRSDESAQKRRKTMAAGDLQAVSGKETFLFGRKAEKGPLECREHKYLRVAGCFETTAVSAIVIPLPLPGSLPKIRKSQKMQLMPSVAKRQLLTEKDEHFESDMAETDLVAMSLFERRGIALLFLQLRLLQFPSSDEV